MPVLSTPLLLNLSPHCVLAVPFPKLYEQLVTRKLCAVSEALN